MLNTFNLGIQVMTTPELRLYLGNNLPNQITYQEAKKLLHGILVVAQELGIPMSYSFSDFLETKKTSREVINSAKKHFEIITAHKTA